MRYFRDPPPPVAPEVAGPLERSDDEREVERRVLDVVRDLFAVLDAHGYRRTSDDAALGRAVVAVWGLVGEYEGQTGGGATPGEAAVDAASDAYRGGS